LNRKNDGSIPGNGSLQITAGREESQEECPMPGPMLVAMSGDPDVAAWYLDPRLTLRAGVSLGSCY
jgi:hypothetical protein